MPECFYFRIEKAGTYQRELERCVLQKPAQSVVLNDPTTFTNTSPQCSFSLPFSLSLSCLLVLQQDQSFCMHPSLIDMHDQAHSPPGMSALVVVLQCLAHTLLKRGHIKQHPWTHCLWPPKHFFFLHFCLCLFAQAKTAREESKCASNFIPIPLYRQVNLGV